MKKALAVESFVVWAISIALAAIFVVAGLPKLLGMDPVGLQAAAMRGFPQWIRVAVGIVELVGGIALLLPAIATPAALLLAFTMVPATITQFVSGEPGTWVPLTLLALLLLVAWRRNATSLRAEYGRFASTPHPLLYEGILAGVIGASTIAVWFLIIDTIAGRPLFTPATLGRGLLTALAFEPQSAFGPAMHVMVYTAFHFAAFMLVGLTAALVVHLARSQPPILFAFILLFVVTEVGIYALVGILHVASPLGRSAWLQIMAGNVLAAVAMGGFFWRRHHELADEFRHSLDWESPDVDDDAVVAPPVSVGTTRDRDAASL
jgi:putative oxidoreductase